MKRKNIMLPKICDKNFNELELGDKVLLLVKWEK